MREFETATRKELQVARGEAWLREAVSVCEPLRIESNGEAWLREAVSVCELLRIESSGEAWLRASRGTRLSLA